MAQVVDVLGAIDRKSSSDVDLEEALSKMSGLKKIEDVEAVRRSYYVARNAHAITRGALPSAVLPDAEATGV